MTVLVKKLEKKNRERKRGIEKQLENWQGATEIRKKTFTRGKRGTEEGGLEHLP